MLSGYENMAKKRSNVLKNKNGRETGVFAGNQPRTKTSEYEIKVEESLKSIFFDNVKRQHGSEIGHEIYSPRPDLIIFPEAEKDETYIYDECVSLAQDGDVQNFITNIGRNSVNWGERNKWEEHNKNPRYFIGVEIENGTSRQFKHILGSMINLSCLCFMGIVVICNTNSIEKLKDYMSFAYERRKIPLLFPNVFMLQRKDFEKIIFLDVEDEMDIRG